MTVWFKNFDELMADNPDAVYCDSSGGSDHLDRPSGGWSKDSYGNLLGIGYYGSESAEFPLQKAPKGLGFIPPNGYG
jgi:hypothetical protein